MSDLLRGEAMSEQLLMTNHYGYKSLDPMPSEDALNRFYQEKYYEEYVEGGERILNEEGRWLYESIYEHLARAIVGRQLGGKVLDVGCGRGDFVYYGQLYHRMDISGIDLSPTAVKAAKARKLPVYHSTFRYLVEDYDHAMAAHCAQPYSAVMMMHYLAHTRDPEKELRGAHFILERGGLLVVRTGNDFNPFQLEAAEKYGRYWVKTPDILHYFDFNSLGYLLRACGFEVLEQWSDYPMASFLLDGRDYINDPEEGKRCHEERMTFDLSLTYGQRRTLYRGLARARLGRCCHVVARKL